MGNSPEDGATAREMRVDEDICTVPLPARLDALAVKELVPGIEEACAANRHLILDFSQVQIVDSSGLGFLIRLWRQNSGLSLVAVNDRVKEFFRFNRVADMFSERTYATRALASELLRCERHDADVPYTLSTLPDDVVVIAFTGRLDALAMKNFRFDELLPKLNLHDCILDLSRLEFADSSGLVAFHRIQRHVAKQGRDSFLYAPNEPVLQLLRLTRLDRLFTITKDKLVLTSRRAL
jgi:anti-anti-sigma factor